jgi:hypothetical protein
MTSNNSKIPIRISLKWLDDSNLFCEDKSMVYIWSLHFLIQWPGINQALRWMVAGISEHWVNAVVKNSRYGIAEMIRRFAYDLAKTIGRFEFYFMKIDRRSIDLVIRWLMGFQHSCDKGGSMLQLPLSEIPLLLDWRSTSLLLCFESNDPRRSSSWAFGALAFRVLNKPHRWSYAMLILSFHFDMIRRLLRLLKQINDRQLPLCIYVGSNNPSLFVPIVSNNLYRPSRLSMAPFSKIDANPSKLNLTLILHLSSFKPLSLLSLIHRNIVDPIVIDNNHEFLLLPDILCNALFMFSLPLELALSISAHYLKSFANWYTCWLQWQSSLC